MELQQYHFTIEHRSGKSNANADALSRMYDSKEPHECFMVFTEDETDTAPTYTLCETCGHLSGSTTWNRKHYYSYARENDRNPWICGYRDAPAKFRYNVPYDPISSDEEEIIYNPRLNKGKQRAYSPMPSDQSDEESLNIILTEDHPETIDLFTYELPFEEYLACMIGHMTTKQVIAGQPITRGGSKCTWECDTKNHHVHTYCKACKRNLPYGTTLHDCIIGFGGRGKIQPDMNPAYLVRVPWWKEPIKVQIENSIYFLRNIQFPLDHLSPLEITIAELD